MMVCSHLEKFKSEHGLENYDTIYNSFVLPAKLPDPAYHQACVSCFDCEHYNSHKIMACMHCIYFGCYDKHYMLHFSSKAHGLFVEISNGNILCNSCKDFIYDAEVDEIIKKYDKVNSGHYVSWKPTDKECKLFKEHPKRVKVDPTSSIGMRGIINLGNSCFMNCIIQALLHTPMLRDYFFTDKHKCYATKSSECLFCLLSRIYQRYYADDDSTTLSLHDILCLVWKNDPNLYGNNQKDAHEFFISARNLLHQVSSPNSQGSCNCIIDSIFHGNLQSDVVCQNCSNVSTKIDPLWEISLDIPELPSEGGLVECLYHFTRPEPLGSNSKINCTACNSYQEGTKQVTFKLLPLVIVIQLKRFQHVNKFKNKKKCLYVPFPIDLDMSPFLTGKRNEKDKKNHCTPDSSIQSSEHGDNRYSLYAVIVHKGILSGGHYVAYIRRTKNKWFNCNDLLVVPVEIEEVLASEGYLLFYHKTVLPYE